MAKSNKPPVFISRQFELGENSATGTSVVRGANYVRDERNETLTFSYDDPSGLFTVDSSTGDIVFAGNPASLDYESGVTSFTLEITVTDSGGNTVTATVTIQLRDLDETPPTTPTLDLIALDDSGLSNTDNITNDALPRITGRADVGTTIEIYDGGVLVGTTTTNKKGSWSFSFGQALSDGDHAISIRAVNAAGIESAEATLLLTIDTTASVPLIRSIEGDNGRLPDDGITNDTTLLFRGTSEPESRIQLLNGSQLLGVTTSDSSGNWVFDFTATSLVDGVYSITAVATDVAGNQSVASSPFQVTIDSAPPAAPASLDLTDASDTGTSNSDDVTGDNTPTITGTAEAGSTVGLYDTNGTTLLGTAVAGAGGTWSITSSALSDGAHTLTARATDLAGNQSGASAGLVITVDTSGGGDTAAPILQSFSSSSADDSYGPGASINITATFDEALRADSTLTVVLDNGQSVVLAAVSGSTLTGTYTVGATGSAQDSADLTVGSISSASVFDLAGNQQTGTTVPAAPNNLGDSSDLVIDTTAPAAPGIALDNDTGVAADDAITNDGSYAVSGAEAGAVVEYSTNGTDWSTTAPTAIEGANSISVRQTDAAGNLSATGTLNFTLDPTAPTGSVDLLPGSDTGNDTDNITSDTTPTLRVSLSNAAVGDSVELLLGGVSFATPVTRTLDAADISNGFVDFTVAAGELGVDGSKSLTAQLSDPAGNSSTTAPLEIRLDTTAPAAPVITAITQDTGESASDGVTNDPTLVLSGVAEPGATIAVTRVGTGVIGSTSADEFGSWSFNYTGTPLAEGEHSFTAMATDTAGNVSTPSAAFVVVVDLTTPTGVVDLLAGSDTGLANTRQHHQ